LGTAYQYTSDVESSTLSMPLKKFADEHGTPSQRFFNVLCLAYGADKELFADFVSKGFLPKERAEGCEDEYAQVELAFTRLITPSIDKRLASRLRKRWLLPVDTHLKKRRSAASVAVRKFARVPSLLRSELPNQSDTSKLTILVSHLNPKFAKVPAEQSCELRVRDTSRYCAVSPPSTVSVWPVTEPAAGLAR
jgi:hypothetical protein